MKTKSMNSVLISGLQGEDDIRDYFLEITDGRSVSILTTPQFTCSKYSYRRILTCGIVYPRGRQPKKDKHSYSNDGLESPSAMRKFCPRGEARESYMKLIMHETHST